MSNFELFFHEKAKKSFDRLDNSIQSRIKDKLIELKEYPERGKHLKYVGFWSLRIGEYRAIYEINKQNNKVIILFIGHRREVYEDLSGL